MNNQAFAQPGQQASNSQQMASAPEATPSLEDVVNNITNENQQTDGTSNQSQEAPIVPNAESETEEDPTKTAEDDFHNKFEKNMELEKEVWKIKESHKREKADLLNQITELKKMIEDNSGKPSQSDDILSELFGDKTEAEETPEVQPINRDDLKAEILKEITEAQEKQKSEAKAESDIQDSINNIKSFVSENSEKYPLISGTENSEMVFNLISAEFDQNLEQYGQDKALELIKGFDHYSERVESYLEKNFKTMLKSDTLKKKLQGFIGNQSETTESTQSNPGPNNLSNSDFTKTNQGQKPESELTDEERFALALKTMSGSN